MTPPDRPDPRPTGTLQDRLKAAMEDCDLSQAALADMIGVKQPSINSLVTGTTTRTKYILDIAAALRVRPEWLQWGRGPKDSMSGDAGESALATARGLSEPVRRGLNRAIQNRQSLMSESVVQSAVVALLHYLRTGPMPDLRNLNDPNDDFELARITSDACDAAFRAESEIEAQSVITTTMDSRIEKFFDARAPHKR